MTTLHGPVANSLSGAGARALLALLVALGLAAPLRAQTGVSDDRVSLPEGPGSLEGVGENVEIDPNMGQMRYSVKIEVPTGHGGMTPAVALSYSSGSGGSVVGMGWSLAMPAIERMTSRGLPEYDLDDEFVADGSDQLVKLTGTNPPVYRSRFEKNFVRYTWLDAGSGTAGHFRAEHADGRISYYGATADGTLVPSARVQGITGTFRYHLVETVDRYGHRIQYDYSQFGGNVTLLQHIGWVFDGATPTYEVTFAYADRSDLLSNCKPGFDELLTKRLTRINVLAHGTRLRYYDLAYEDYATSGGFSRLTSVQMYGRDATAYPVHESFTYSRALGVQCTGVDCQRPYVASMGSIGGGLTAGKATLIDLNGDALPDIVDASQAGPHSIYLNQLDVSGTSSFLPPVPSAVATQSSHGLGSSGYVQVLDADGDGRTDMLNVQTGQVLRNLGGGDWDTTVVSLWEAANAPFNETDMATMHYLDYDNDKRIDLIRSQGSGVGNLTAVFRNMLDGTFVEDNGVENIGAGFDTDRIELNDINGDGLLDAVHVSLSEVRFWLNLGWGRWDARPPISGVSFTDLDQAARAELEDLNGDALADLVLVEGNELKYWINRNGDTFDPVRTVTSADIDGDMPVRDAGTVVLFADMNGNGSSDPVWIDSNGNVTFLELFPVRPNLLSRIENGLGKVTEITYGSSVHHMARDREAGAPWSYPLPFPMMVVERYDEWNELTNVHEVKSYVFHNGFYDGVEKQFRGYAQVEQVEAGDAFSEDGQALEVYDVGATDAYRNGLLLRSEIQGAGGRSLQVSVHTYDDCTVAGLPGGALLFDVRHICKVGEEVEHREGRPPAEWVTTEKRWEHDGYGNVTLEADLGVTAIGDGDCAACSGSGYDGTPCDAQCLGDETYDATTYAAPETNGDRWILRSEVRSRVYGVADGSGEPANANFSESVTYYDGPAFEGLALGQVTHGTVSRVVNRKTAAGDTVDEDRNRIDAHGNVIESLDPLGAAGGNTHRRLWTMDPLGLRVVRTEILLENSDGPYRLVQDTDYHPLFDVPVEATNWMVFRGGVQQSPRSARSWGYDEFARVVNHTKAGEQSGFTSEEYTWVLGSPTSKAIIAARTAVGGPLDFVQVHCFDGHGRKFQERTRLTATEFRVTGFKVFNSKGEEIQVFQPYLSTSADCDTAPPAGTGSVLTRFDTLGRKVLQVFPDTDPADGEDEIIRTEYLPLVEVEHDLEDTRAGSPHAATPRTKRHNGLGQLLADEQLLTPTGASIVDRYGYDELGNLARVVDPAGHTRTQSHDLLGNVVAVDDPDRGQITMGYDAASNLVRRVDASGAIRRFEFDGAGRVLAEWDEADPTASRVENSFDLAVSCPAATCTNTAGELVRTTYPLDDGTQGEDRFGYDERTNRTYLSRRLDGHLFEFRSLYNNLDHVIRNVFPSGIEIDYELFGDGKVARVPGYIDSVHYAPSGGADEIAFASGATTSHAFDARTRLASIDVLGPSNQVHLAYTYHYDRQSNLVEVEDGRADDGGPMGSATFAYDALYRLTRATLDPDRSEHEEILDYTYDTIGNLTGKSSSLGSQSPDHVGTLVYGEDGAGPHAVTTAGSTAIGYDAAGRVTSKGSASFSWDFQGRLVGAVNGVGEVSRYVYARGPQRVIKREGGSTSYFVCPDFEVRDGVATTYLRIGDAHVAKIREADYASRILSDVAPATGADNALVAAPDSLITAADAWLAQAVGEGVLDFAAATELSSVESLLEASLQRLLAGDGDQLHFLHQDHLGGTVAVTDEAGDLVERYEYHPYGGERYAMGPGQEYGYAGRERDQATGLLYYGARYYDPWTGRWTAPDPAFEVVDEENLEAIGEASFAYAFNRGNPMSNVDQDGQEPVTATIIAVGALAGMVGAVAATVISTGVSITKSVVNMVRGKDTVSKGMMAIGKTLITGGLSMAIGAVVGAGVGALFAFATPAMSAAMGAGVGEVVGALAGAVVGAVVDLAARAGALLLTKTLPAIAAKLAGKDATTAAPTTSTGAPGNVGTNTSKSGAKSIAQKAVEQKSQLRKTNGPRPAVPGKASRAKVSSLGGAKSAPAKGPAKTEAKSSK